MPPMLVALTANNDGSGEMVMACGVAGGVKQCRRNGGINGMACK